MASALDVAVAWHYERANESLKRQLEESERARADLASDYAETADLRQRFERLEAANTEMFLDLHEHREDLRAVVGECTDLQNEVQTLNTELNLQKRQTEFWKNAHGSANALRQQAEKNFEFARQTENLLAEELVRERRHREDVEERMKPPRKKPRIASI